MLALGDFGGFSYTETLCQTEPKDDSPLKRRLLYYMWTVKEVAKVDATQVGSKCLWGLHPEEMAGSYPATNFKNLSAAGRHTGPGGRAVEQNLQVTAAWGFGRCWIGSPGFPAPCPRRCPGLYELLEGSRF